MEPHVNDDLEQRLRAARPSAASADESAFDAELLARVRTLPIASRHTVPRAVAIPVAAGVTLTVSAVVMLGGGPGNVGGPSSASAITQAMHWLSPTPGTILHVRSVETYGTSTTTREFWQSADHPDSQRLLTEGDRTFETSGDEIYDPATNTIYESDSKQKPGEVAGEDQKRMSPADVAAEKAKRIDVKKVTPAGAPAGSKPGPESVPVGDPIVQKVRTLLGAGSMVVSGPETHNGVEAWVISLRPDAGRPVWTLWVSTADGRPLELRDPGRDANEAAQVIRWTTYETLPDSDADKLVTLAGAHPSARVVNDPAEAAAAEERLMARKG